ncbi:MAG: sigma-70 family RNA polymerase sigma factor [Chloroflexota bacterium]
MDLTQRPVSELAAACRRETEKFRRGEPSRDDFCFELFRRAVCERHEEAWEAVIAQYRGIVLTWVRRNSAAGREDADFWLNRTFDRFWSAVGPERFGMFDGLPKLLKYLQMCATTAVLDEARAQRAAQWESLDQGAEDGERTARDTADTAMDVEASAVGRLAGREVWDTILGELPDEAERAVIYLSFALSMKPGEIHEHRRDLFPTVADVYRLKRNVLERLRRNPALRRLQD